MQEAKLWNKLWLTCALCYFMSTQRRLLQETVIIKEELHQPRFEMQDFIFLTSTVAKITQQWVKMCCYPEFHTTRIHVYVLLNPRLQTHRHRNTIHFPWYTCEAQWLSGRLLRQTGSNLTSNTYLLWSWAIHLTFVLWFPYLWKGEDSLI